MAALRAALDERARQGDAGAEGVPLRRALQELARLSRTLEERAEELRRARAQAALVPPLQSTVAEKDAQVSGARTVVATCPSVTLLPLRADCVPRPPAGAHTGGGSVRCS